MMDSQSQEGKLLKLVMTLTLKRSKIMNKHPHSQVRQVDKSLKVKKLLVEVLPLMLRAKKLQTNLLTWQWT